MRGLSFDLRAAWQFMRTGFRQMDKNASLFPSSRFLAAAMVSAARLENAKCVVELGPGTGVVTERILRGLGPDAHVHAVELDPGLLAITTERIKDKRLRPHHGSAANADKLVRESGCTLGADAILSSLGLALMSDSLRAEILEAAENLLLPDRTFVQYAYPHARLLTYQFKQGWSQYNARKFLLEHFQEVDSKMVWLNAPPASVHACRMPLARPAVTPLPLRHSRASAGRRRRAAGAGNG